jgi:hypothetical protein
MRVVRSLCSVLAWLFLISLVWCNPHDMYLSAQTTSSGSTISSLAGSVSWDFNLREHRRSSSIRPRKILSTGKNSLAPLKAAKRVKRFRLLNHRRQKKKRSRAGPLPELANRPGGPAIPLPALSTFCRATASCASAWAECVKKRHA